MTLPDADRPRGAMRIDPQIDEMRHSIARRDWEGLEDAYATPPRVEDGPTFAVMGSLDLASYETELARTIDRIAERLDRQVAAVYWEFDVDNAWASSFFMCRTYHDEGDRDDDWASDFDAHQVVAGPSAPAISALQPATWGATDADAALTLYLIARTVASFGRAATAWRGPIPLCAGYHDQSLVFRITSSTG